MSLQWEPYMKKKDVNKQNKLIPAESSLLFYTTPDGNEKIEVRLENETVWLTQAAMAELFQTTAQNITIHLKEIYAAGELTEEATWPLIPAAPAYSIVIAQV